MEGPSCREGWKIDEVHGQSRAFEGEGVPEGRGLTASPAQQAAAIVRKTVQAIGFLVNAAGGLENAQSTRGRLVPMGSAEERSRQVG